MTQIQICNGDLYFIFKKYDENEVPLVYRLDNGGELEFINDECVSLILPNFEQQLNRGSIQDIVLENTDLQDDDFTFKVVVDGQNINGRINLSSLNSKI